MTLNSMYEEIVKFGKIASCEEEGTSHIRKTNVCAYVILDEEGNFLGIEEIPKKEREVKRIPYLGSIVFSGKGCNAVCEKANIVLGTKSLKRETYLEILQDGVDFGVQSVKSILLFEKKFQEDEAFRESVLCAIENASIADADTISFRTNGITFEDAGDWDNWIDDWCNRYAESKGRTGGEMIVSSISGKIQETVPENGAPTIKGVSNGVVKAAFGVAKDVYVASASNDSYESYGILGAKGSRIGKEDAENLAKGIAFLLNNENHRNTDFNLLYWYNNEEMYDLLGDILSGKVDEVGNLEEELEKASTLDEALSIMTKGVKVGDIPIAFQMDGEYRIVQMRVPSQGRFLFSASQTGKYKNLYENIMAWYEDTKITEYRGEVSQIFVARNLYGMLLQLISLYSINDINKKKDCIKNEFGDGVNQLLTSIYKNHQIPKVFFHGAVRNFEKAITKGEFPKKTWAQIIKCYLKRKGEDVMDVLNSDGGRAYQCGRMLAVYEREFSLYHGFSKKMVDKYYAFCLRRPSAAFAKLSEMSAVWETKVKGKRCKELLGEISEKIGEAFPLKFTEEEKGAFALGYYQQRNEFFKKSEEPEEEVVETVEA